MPDTFSTRARRNQHIRRREHVVSRVESYSWVTKTDRSRFGSEYQSGLATFAAVNYTHVVAGELVRSLCV